MKINKFFVASFALVLIIALVVPLFADALVPGPFDYFQKVIAKAEDSTGPIMAKVIDIFSRFVLGMILMLASADLLDKVVFAQADWLTISESPMVIIGWRFTVGLANMSIILFLIFLAFQLILKIDTPETKKALVRLFLVAFLLNFSLVFIEVILDVVDVFYTSILLSVREIPNIGAESLFGAMAETLIGGKSRVVRDFTLMMIGWAVAAWVPGGVIKHTIISVTYVVAYLPIILGWLIQAIFFYMIAGVFALLTFLFVVRVYVLQFLAILSPLAILALILKQTRKYFNTWLQHFVQWLLLGLFLIFFMALGVASLNVIMPPSLYEPSGQWLGVIPFASWRGVPREIAFYFFVFCYLAVVIWLAKKATPEIAQAMIDTVKAVPGMVWTQGIKPLGSAMRKEAGDAARATEKQEEKYNEEVEKATEQKKDPPKKPRSLTVAGWAAKRVRTLYHWQGTTPELEESKETEAGAAELEKQFGKDTKSAMEVVGYKGKSDRIKSKMALYLAKMEGGGERGLGMLDEYDRREAAELVGDRTPYNLKTMVAHTPGVLSDKEARRKDLAEARAEGDEVTAMAINEYEKAEKAGDQAKMEELQPATIRRCGEATERIRNKMVKEGISQNPDGTFKDSDIQAMSKAGVLIDGQDINTLIQSDIGKIKVIRAAAFKKSVEAMKTSDIENLAISTIEDSNFQESVARYRSDTSFIRKIGEEKGQQYIDKIRAKMENLGAKEIAKTNLAVLRSSVRNPGFRSIFSPISGAANEKEIGALETDIKAKQMGVAKITRGPITLPPTRPPEVPKNWVHDDDKKTWIPPKGHTPRVPVSPADEHGVVEEIRKMTKELNRLREEPMKSEAEKEAITMLENTIKEFREKLGK